MILIMGRPGFEPGTNRLKAEYSTVELATLLHSKLQLSQYIIKSPGNVKGWRKSLPLTAQMLAY